MQNYWPLEQSEKIKREYEKMNGCCRLLRLLKIADTDLFVLANDIDTYVYLLFSRNVIYLLTILCVIDCGVLIPLYITGDVSEQCNN